MLTLTQLTGFGAFSVAGGLSYNFVTSVSDRTTASHTYSSTGIGTAAADRLVVVAFGGSNNSATVSSVTIGGNAATVYYIGTAQPQIVGFAVLLVTSGTTADIVINFSTTQDHGAIAVYSVYGANATPTATDFTDTTDTYQYTANVPAGGLVIACATDNNSSTEPQWTWTGPTEDRDISMGAKTFSSASALLAAGDAAYAITADKAGTSGGGRLGVIVFQPA